MSDYDFNADSEKRLVMHPQRYHWIQAAAAVLLVLTLPACTRSANTVMTPLPSAPPPTPTGIATTEPPPAPATSTATAAGIATSRSSVTPSPAESQPVKTATVTQGSTATAVTCGNALPSRLRVEAYAYVNPDPPLPNNLRSEAGQANTLLGEIQPGQAMKILDGPKCVDGGFWWKVSPLETDQVGWTAEGDDQNYWLIPCSSEKECGT
ncbi:MAG: SH3 domain-containing protein [Anaerolineales bacterium]|nr:SH3 domain-containing protein [Anaerolineales bacterium]